MSTFSKMDYYLTHPGRSFDYLVSNCMKWLPDALYLKFRYYARFGYWPDFESPKSFNEKICWLKLYDRKPEYTALVDKWAVKDYIRAKVGERYVIPTIGVWNSPQDIIWNELPTQFVLKTTHGGGGGGVIICRDKSELDIDAAVHKLSVNLTEDIYSYFREWPYKNIRRRVIAEEFIGGDQDLNDFKFFCFGGKVRCFKVDFNRQTCHQANYYDRNCSLLPFGEKEVPPDFSRKLEIPENIEDMIYAAERLSEGYPFLRVDLYNVKGRIFFGELTFYPASGLGLFTDSRWDRILGSWIDLNKVIK